MPQIIVLQPFKFAHHGHQVEAFEPSPEPRDTSEECADIAVREKWAKPAKAAKAGRETAAAQAAPENANAAGTLEHPIP